MVIEAIILTASTVLSNGMGNFAQANKIAAINNRAQQIIEASAGFDYENFDFTYDQQQNIVKQKLVEYNKENELFDLEYLEKISDELKNDPNYVDLSNFNEDIDQQHSTFSKIKSDISVASTFDDKFKYDFGDVGGGGTNEGSNEKKQDLLPILPENPQKAQATINGKLFGKNFLGIVLTPEACIAVYNIIANLVTNKEYYKAGGKLIVEIMQRYTPALYASTHATLVGIFTGLWSKITAFFSNLVPPYSHIIAAIALFVGFAIITIIVTMFLLGSQKKGYAAGFIIHNWIRWEPYAGEI